jgi:ankyrin repeat protein
MTVSEFTVTDVAEWLISEEIGADVDLEDHIGETAIHKALDLLYYRTHSKLNILQALLKKSKKPRARSRSSQTRLQIAAALGNSGPLKLPLDSKKCELITAEMVEALSVSSVDCMNLFLERDPNLFNARSPAGCSSLEMAVKESNIDVVERLIEEGCQLWDFRSALFSPMHLVMYIHWTGSLFAV